MHPALIQAVRDCRADATLSALMADGFDRVAEIELTEAEIDGRAMRFATDKARDPIQRRHRHGKFFETEELSLIRRYLPDGGTFIDIGANVGNHSLFAGKFCDAGRIIPFEPNPLAYRMLILNVLMNDLRDRVVFDHVGVGASDLDRHGFGMTEREKNLGAARMVPDEGEISTVRPDDVLRDETPDVIKIDVEGMEIAVLRGLQKTVSRTRPVLLVEVEQGNNGAFADWRLAHGFKVVKQIKRYKENRNVLCVPAERMMEFATAAPESRTQSGE